MGHKEERRGREKSKRHTEKKGEKGRDALEKGEWRDDRDPEEREEPRLSKTERKTHRYGPALLSPPPAVVLSGLCLVPRGEDRSLGTGSWGRREQVKGWMSGEG